MPVDRDAKMEAFGPDKLGGIGLITFALCLTLVHQKQISMARMIEALSMVSASILDIEGGTLSPVVLLILFYFGPTVADHYRCQFHFGIMITPFESHPVQGLVDATCVNGEPVFTRALMFLNYPSGMTANKFNDFESLLLVVCFAYGLGSIPFGLILTRLAGAGDIRGGQWKYRRNQCTANRQQEIGDCGPRFRRAGKGATAVLFATTSPPQP